MLTVPHGPAHGLTAAGRPPDPPVNVHRSPARRSALASWLYGTCFLYAEPGAKVWGDGWEEGQLPGAGSACVRGLHKHTGPPSVQRLAPGWWGALLALPLLRSPGVAAQ